MKNVRQNFDGCKFMQMCLEPWQQHRQHPWLVNPDEVLLFQLISHLIDAITVLDIARISLDREVANFFWRNLGLFSFFEVVVVERTFFTLKDHRKCPIRFANQAN